MFDPEGERKYLNEAEREVFRRAALREPDPGARDFLLTLLRTGCRISEALALRGDRVDGGERALVFQTLKRRGGGHFRMVPIPDDLAQRLIAQALAVGPEGRLWPWSRKTGYRRVKEAMGRAGLAGVKASPKGLRHGFAVACVLNDVPLTTVRKWMGHARLETTDVYLDVLGEEERRLARRLWKAR